MTDTISRADALAAIEDVANSFEGTLPNGLINQCYAAIDALAAISALPAVGWQPIETFPGDHPYWTSDYGNEAVPIDERETRYYDALVCGPTWDGGWDSPHSKKDGNFWTGDIEVAISSTYTGLDFWTISSRGPSDYDDYIKPTHWMPLPDAPKE